MLPLNLRTAPTPELSTPPVLIVTLPGSPKKPPPPDTTDTFVIPPLPSIVVTLPVAEVPPAPLI